MRRDIDCAAGRFGFEDYVDHLIDFLNALGPNSPRPGGMPAVRAGVGRGGAHGEDRHPAQPRSMTLMPVPSIHVNPTAVNELALGKSLDWFERN